MGKKNLIIVMIFSALFASTGVAHEGNGSLSFRILCGSLLEGEHGSPEKSHGHWYDVIMAMKTRLRRGWSLRGVPDSIGESILSHSSKVRHAASLYPNDHRKLNTGKMEDMALVHDIAEYDSIDVIPADNIRPEVKRRMEEETIDRMIEKVGPEAKKIKELWLEYEANATKEAILCKQLDKMDSAVQALRYEKLFYKVSDFYPYVEARLKDPLLLKILRILLKREFKQIDPYLQYYTLLVLNGDEAKFRDIMSSQN